MFQEWQLTEEANSMENSFRNSLRFPSCADSFTVKLFRRDTNLMFNEFYSQTLEKSSVKYEPEYSFNRIDSVVHDKGNFQHKLELVFVSEGYTEPQKTKFFSDANRFKEVLFDWEPYRSNQEGIRIRAVFIESPQEGVDVPSESVWCRTNFNSTFGTITNLNVFLNKKSCTHLDTAFYLNINQEFIPQ